MCRNHRKATCIEPRSGQEQDRKYKQVSICFVKNKKVARCKARCLGNDVFLRIFGIILVYGNFATIFAAKAGSPTSKRGSFG